ncbi:MAG: glycosyltransferase [Candidatus Brocadiaceae bacterium]|nr:glycosyltransferase [Candidatus Brocadiaceae bacterium]
MTTTRHQITKKNDRPTLSACMIVKNEEKFLAQCLESVKNAVDEIIVVDTGSTDRTVEIAQSFGAKLYHHPWRNNFSEARNYSLGYATGDWILQIDADEELEQEDIPELHKTIKENPNNAVYIAIYSELRSGQSKHYFARLYRRGKACYEGIVHNQLVFQGRASTSEIRLYHYGYNLSEDEMVKKYKRTGDLLRKQIEENPEDIFSLANLVRNYRNERNYEKVVEIGEGVLNMKFDDDSSTKNQLQRISIDLAYGLLDLKQLDRAEEICKMALKANPHFLDTNYLLGNILEKKNNYEEAIKFYKNYLVIKEKQKSEHDFNLLIVDTYEYEYRVYANMGACFENLGRNDEAEVSYKKSIEYNNKESLPYRNLTHLYLSQNKYSQAESIANIAVGLSVADKLTYLFLGKAQIMLGKREKAIDTYKQLIRKEGKDVSAYICLIDVLADTNQNEEAEKIVRESLRFFPENISLQCLMAKIRYLKGDKENVLDFIKKKKEYICSDNNALLSMGNLCIEIEEYKMAIELLEKHVETATVTDASVISNIATCYAKMGEMESAIIGFQSALKINPQYGYASKNLQIIMNSCT